MNNWCDWRGCTNQASPVFLGAKQAALWLCTEHEEAFIKSAMSIPHLKSQPQPLTADKPAVQYDKGRLAKNECPFCAVSFDGWQITQGVMHIFECLLKDYEARMAALERR